MSTLIEVAEFISGVLRLDLDMSVRGFDGTEIGPANEQAQALANRTLWLKKNIERIDGIIEVLKDPENVLKKHLLEADPHEQYLTKEKGNDLFLDKKIANIPNGYLQLDENGLLPSKIAKLYEARYLILDDEKARLSINESKNITICLQLSDNIVYYLNPNTDPSIDDNWERGETTDINNVVSVFGRSGFVLPQAGDYNTDQITETENKVFVTPTEKKTWNSKQELLESGVNLSTIFGQSLLTGKNITLSDILELNKVIGNLLIGKNGVEVKVDEENKQLVIEGPGEGLSKLRIFEVENAIAGKRYNYPLVGEQSFDFQTSTFFRSIHKEETKVIMEGEKIIENSIFSPVPDFDPEYSRFKSGDNTLITLMSSTNSPEQYSSKDISSPDDDVCALLINVEKATKDVIPIFTSSGTYKGVTPFSSDVYGAFEAWKSFQSPLTATERKKVPNKDHWSDLQYWRNRKTEVFLGVKFSNPQSISGYSFQNFESFYWGGNSSIPTSWSFQGRNSDSESWITIDKRHSQVLMSSQDKWSKYILDKPVKYKQYRILVSDVTPDTGRAAIPRLQFHTEPGVLIKDSNGIYTTIDSDKLSIIEKPTINDFIPATNISPIEFTKSELSFPIKICTDITGTIKIQFYKTEGLLGIFDPSKNPDLFSDLTIGFNKLELTKVTQDNDVVDIKIALAIDGENYYTLTNDVWTELGKITNDLNSADLVLKYGIPAGKLKEIVSDQWKELIEKSNSTDFKFAYAKKVSVADGSFAPKEIVAYSGAVTEWTKVYSDKVEVILTEKYLSFKPLVDGTYKFCYRFM